MGDDDDDDARAPLNALLGASLLEPAEATGRYTQHRLLHTYARALLSEKEEFEAVAARHFDYYEGLLGEKSDHTDTDYLRSIEVDLPELRVTLEWGFIHQPERACDLLAALGNFFGVYQPAIVHRPLLERALGTAEKADYTRGLANTMKALGDLSRLEDDLPAARAYYHRAEALFDAIGDRAGLLNTLRQYALLEKQAGNIEKAMGFYEQCLTLADSIPAYANHPVVQGWRREYEQLSGS